MQVPGCRSGLLSLYRFPNVKQDLNLAPFALGPILEGNVVPNVTRFCEDNLHICRDDTVQPDFPYSAATCPFPLAGNPSLCSLKQYASFSSCVSYFGALAVGQPSLGTGLTQVRLSPRHLLTHCRTAASSTSTSRVIRPRSTASIRGPCS